MKLWPNTQMLRQKVGIAALLILLACVFVVADGPPGNMHRLQQKPPIRLGTSGINLRDVCSAGTLGSLVTKNHPFVVYILSNNHVIARTNEGRPGDPIVQRATLDTQPKCSRNGIITVAALSLFRSIKFDGSDNEIDAAVAGIVPGKVDPAGAILDIGRVNHLTVAPALDLAVKKSGRTTGTTRGTITMVNATIMVNYGNGRVAKFVHQIEITPAAPVDLSFCASGDSGSLLVTNVEKRPNPVGLVFAGGAAVCFANPIRAVLQAFGVGFPLTSEATLEPQANSDRVESTSSDPAVDLVSAVKERYDDYLLRLPEAVGTGVGRAANGSGNVVIKLLVRELTSEATQAAPQQLEGVSVEVEEVGVLSAL